MNINELQLGNLVYMDKITKFPMKVVGLFEDMVYLDFEGNEGDRFEVKAEHVEPIPITAEILEKSNFRKTRLLGYDSHYEYTFYDNSGRAFNLFALFDSDFSFKILNDARKIQYLHQLQNAMRMVGIEWKVKL